MNEYKIDPELNALLPELPEEEYRALEQSILMDGFKGAPIVLWGDVIVDGHNRYEICKKHNIEVEVQHLDFENKEDVKVWMIRQQLGRRTLTPIQRVELVQKFRPFYKKKADENRSRNGGDKKSKSKKSTTPLEKSDKIDVRSELAREANVSTDTFSKGEKILNSGNVELIEQTKRGEKSINKAYNELTGRNKNVQAALIAVTYLISGRHFLKEYQTMM